MTFKVGSLYSKVTFEIIIVRFKREFAVRFALWDMRKCPFYVGVRFIVVRFIEVFL